MEFASRLLCFLLVNCIGLIASFPANETGVRVKRMVNGTVAKTGEFPYVVRVERFNNLQCTGVLISEQAVLTAQGCIPEKDQEQRPISGENYRVILGKVFLLQRGREIISKVKSIHIRESKKDVAIINLVEPVKFSRSIQPIALSQSRFVYEEGTVVYSCGWGPRGPDSKRLRYKEMRIARNGCGIYGMDFSTPFRLCAQNLEDRVCSGPGDKGGPLVLKSSEGDILLGILSSMTDVCAASHPEVFSSVSWHAAWIQGYAAGNVRFVKV